MRRRILISMVTLSVLGYCLTTCDIAGNMESPFDRYFVKYIGLAGNQTGVDMVKARDESIYILGNTGAGADKQLFVAHVTAEGNVLWDKVIGTPNNVHEACDIELLTNRNIAILATTSDAAGSYRNFVVRVIDSLGNMVDSVTYGQTNYHWNAYSFSETTDSFIVSGSTDSVAVSTDPANAFAVRFDKTLRVNPDWKMIYGSDTDLDAAVRVVEVPSEGLFYTFGHSQRLGEAGDGLADYNVMIWVLNTTGEFRNTIMFVNSCIPKSGPNDDERLGSVSVIPPNNGFVMSGYAAIRATDQQRLFAMTIRKDLEFVNPIVASPNHEIFQAPPRLDEASQSQISLTRSSAFSSQGLDGGFLVLGSENENIYLKKLDDRLEDAWTSPSSFLFGGIGNDLPGTVLESRDGRILVLGTIVLGDIDGQQKIVLMKLSPNGRLGE